MDFLQQLIPLHSPGLLYVVVLHLLVGRDLAVQGVVYLYLSAKFLEKSLQFRQLLIHLIPILCRIERLLTVALLADFYLLLLLVSDVLQVVFKNIVNVGLEDLEVILLVEVLLVRLDLGDYWDDGLDEVGVR